MSNAAGAFLDGKNGFLDLGRRFLKDPDIPAIAAPSKPHKLASHELTLSYLCDNPKDVAGGKDLLGAMEAGRGKGKEIVEEEEVGRCVERDFLRLSWEAATLAMASKT